MAVNPLLYLEGSRTSSELQRMDPMKDIVNGTKVVLEKDIETSGRMHRTQLLKKQKQQVPLRKQTVEATRKRRRLGNKCGFGQAGC